MIKVVLYCLCQSDSASVLLYFTLTVLVLIGLFLILLIPMVMLVDLWNHCNYVLGGGGVDGVSTA